MLQASLKVAGEERSVAIYLPASRGPQPPLLLVFHGTDGNAEDAIWGADGQTLADNQGVVVIAPQARKMSQGDWDNHTAGQTYFETYPSTDVASNPDLQLVQAIIAEARRAYGVDSKRVYCAGFSNGGFFSLAAAMALPDLVAAFAENSAGLVRCATTADCEFSGSGTSCGELATQSGYCSCSGTEKPISIPTGGYKPPGLLAHAADDGTVSPYYTCDLAARMQSLGFTTQVEIRASGGHDWPTGFAEHAWQFLSQHTHPAN